MRLGVFFGRDMSPHTLPLGVFMASASRLVIQSARLADCAPRVVLAGELADRDPVLPTFRVPEIAELLGREDAFAVAIRARVLFAGRVQVHRATVERLFQVAPGLSLDALNSLWEGWPPPVRARYKRLRAIGFGWLAVPPASASDSHRALVASWAAMGAGLSD